jgi:hypothetical protein
MAITQLQNSLRVSVFLLFLVPALATGQNSSSPKFFDGQQWEFGLWGGEAFGKTLGQAFGETQISMGGFHMGRVFYESPLESSRRRSWEYTIELQPLFFVTRPGTTYGGGFSPLGFKWNFAPRHGSRYRPYLECNGGAMFTQKNVPPGNTETFNFTAAVGPGMMIAVRDNQALSVAVRYWHLSNGGLGYNNPAFNTVQIVIGYHWLTGRRQSRRPMSTADPAK